MYFARKKRPRAPYWDRNGTRGVFPVPGPGKKERDRDRPPVPKKEETSRQVSLLE